ncbi:MAG: 6-carboxytetrahydropterin synthase [Dehalococcoidia bacterium]|nr:6-carboxytetrahydropterin synthase [Dehalococcoidia bacterium]
MSTYRVTRKIDFCYGHRLLNHDGKCRYLHGHNGLLEVDVESTVLDNMGMVVDFGLVKDVVKGWVDTNLDHRMLLSRSDPVVPSLEQLGEPFYLMDGNPTAENIARLIFLHARELGLEVSEVRLWETPSNCAVYREGA